MRATFVVVELVPSSLERGELHGRTEARQEVDDGAQRRSR